MTFEQFEEDIVDKIEGIMEKGTILAKSLSAKIENIRLVMGTALLPLAGIAGLIGHVDFVMNFEFAKISAKLDSLKWLARLGGLKVNLHPIINNIPLPDLLSVLSPLGWLLKFIPLGEIFASLFPTIVFGKISLDFDLFGSLDLPETDFIVSSILGDLLQLDVEMDNFLEFVAEIDLDALPPCDVDFGDEEEEEEEEEETDDGRNLASSSKTYLSQATKWPIHKDVTFKMKLASKLTTTSSKQQNTKTRTKKQKRRALQKSKANPSKLKWFKTQEFSSQVIPKNKKELPYRFSFFGLKATTLNNAKNKKNKIIRF